MSTLHFMFYCVHSSIYIIILCTITSIVYHQLLLIDTHIFLLNYNFKFIGWTHIGLFGLKEKLASALMGGARQSILVLSLPLLQQED